LYVAQQLRGLPGAWWASDIAALPADHHVPWSEFRTAFCAHHLYAGLLRTKLKVFWQLTRQSFSNATDPLEADSWLRTAESKFGLIHCTEYQKTLYVAQQLRGLAGAWWASDIAALPTDHHFPWSEFRTTFRAHHLSAGLLRTKLKEFLDLEQGNHSVFNYPRQFNTLAQYGSYHIDTDEQKANLYYA
jgi:hypothetical protein